MLLTIARSISRRLKLKSGVKANLGPFPTSNTETHNSSATELLFKQESLEECEYPSLKPEFEIKAESLKIMEIINQGNFSTLHRGELRMKKHSTTKLEVVLKIQNRPDVTHQQMILKELGVMCDIGRHPNVLALVGFIVIPNEIMVILEHVTGENLQSYLRRLQNIFSAEDSLFCNDDFISVIDLLSFAYQIANGLKYLACVSYIHQHLSLRNIFLTSDKIIRIGNLESVRKLGTDEQDDKHNPIMKPYGSADIINQDAPAQLERNAPEAFTGHKFMEKSGVWSYGVCLYELFSFGKISDEGMEDVLTNIRKGRELIKPDDLCHQKIYEFMIKCLCVEPVNRPCFSECVKFFENQLNEYGTETLEDIIKKLKMSLFHQSQLDHWICGARENDN